jgi:hypothetical protein
VLAGSFEFTLQLVGGIEMVFDATLGATGHTNHLPDSGCIGFFHGVLDQRLVHHRQHFFGRSFGGRQKAAAQPGDGENGFFN